MRKMLILSIVLFWNKNFRVKFVVNDMKLCYNFFVR